MDDQDLETGAGEAMMKVEQLRELVVRPVLQELNMYSEAAENLVLGTAAQESLLGTFIKQYPTGPAMGIYQMEPATHGDIWDNYLAYNDELSSQVRGFASQHLFTRNPHNELVTNLFYSTAMCRLHYRRVKAPLPSADNVEGLAHYWKQYYNTPKGKGRVIEFIDNYHAMVLGSG